MISTRISLAVALAMQVIVIDASAEGTPSAGTASGRAIVRVETIPDLGSSTLRFAGVPAGEVVLSSQDRRSLTAGALAAGEHSTTLTELDPALVANGYRLMDIRCDDLASAARSSGDLQNRKATFRIEDGETVTCVFVLSAQTCVCPKEGKWSVTNHPGSMVCTGVVSMTTPLKPSTGSGTLKVLDGCSKIIASGLSEKEATIEMRAADGCGYQGSVGGAQDGIPMTIEFTWDVHDSERISGNLRSTVSQQGMTCNMSRTYALEFSGS
jgi:hypothetical protein